MSDAYNKKDLEAYALLRVRLRDFIHLTLLWHAVGEGADPLKGLPSHGREQLLDTLRTASIGWLASLVDPHAAAVNAFVIWPKIFPEVALQVKETQKAFAPYDTHLQAFRGTIAFHSNKSYRRHIAANKAIQSPGFVAAMDRFFSLAETVAELDGRSESLARGIEQVERAADT